MVSAKQRLAWVRYLRLEYMLAADKHLERRTTITCLGGIYIFNNSALAVLSITVPSQL